MPLIQPITPVELAKPAVSISIESVVFRFSGESYAFASTALLDEDGKLVESATVSLTSDDLANWGDDDQVLLDIVKTKLGL